MCELQASRIDVPHKLFHSVSKAYAIPICRKPLSNFYFGKKSYLDKKKTNMKSIKLWTQRKEKKCIKSHKV